MKNLKLILTSLFFLFVLNVFASQLVVNVKAYKETNNQSYVLCVKKYDITFTFGYEYDDIYFSQNGKFNIELEPGRYNFCVLYPNSAPFYYNIYLKDKKHQVDFNIELDKYCIPEKIDSVKMFGNFNDYNNTDAIKLKYNVKKKYWYLPKNEIPSNLELFKFYINHDLRAYLLNNPIDTIDKWASPSNIFNKKDNEIIFNPSNFKRGEPKPKISGTFDSTYHIVFEKIQSNYLEAYYKARSIKNETELDLYKNNQNQYFDFCKTLKTSYGKTYPWLFVEYEYLLNEFNFQAELTLAQSKKSDIAIRKIFNSLTYTEKVKNQARILYNADVNELLLTDRMINAFWQMDYDVESRGLLLEEKYSYGYFKKTLFDILDKTDNNQIGGKILDLYCSQMSYNNPELASKYLEKIVINYPLYSGNKKGLIASKLNGLAVKEGSKAPLFSIKSIKGTNISLSDLKGKYVFIDFWGNWCSPCRGEIPNIIALSESFPESKLVVIGLANDSEETLKAFIEKNKIPYENAVADDGLLKKYGINSFPTTLLINPDGVIVQKNLRGSNLVDMVKSLIE